MPFYTCRPTLPYINGRLGRTLITGTLGLNPLAQLKVATKVLSSVKNIVVNSQEHMLYQDRKALAFVVAWHLFNTEYVPFCLHSCFLLRSGERRKKDLEANLDPRRGALTGTNKGPSLADITCPTLTPFYGSVVRPPKYCLRDQGEPNEFSGVFRPIHPSPQARYWISPQMLWAPSGSHKTPDVI